MITIYYNYPWGRRPVKYESFELVIHDELTNEYQKEFAYNNEEFDILKNKFNALKEDKQKEYGFIEYTSRCFEIIKKGRDIKNPMKICYRLTGYLDTSMYNFNKK